MATLVSTLDPQHARGQDRPRPFTLQPPVEEWRMENAPLGGLVGPVALQAEDWTRFLPWLLWGQFVHVGKDAVKWNIEKIPESATDFTDRAWRSPAAPYITHGLA